MDKLTKQAIEEYKKLIDYRGSEWGIINPLGMKSFIVKWLSKAFKAGVEEGRKEEFKKKVKEDKELEYFCFSCGRSRKRCICAGPKEKYERKT